MTVLMQLVVTDVVFYATGHSDIYVHHHQLIEVAPKCGLCYSRRGISANGAWVCDVQFFHTVACPLSCTLSLTHSTESFLHKTHTSAQHASTTSLKGIVLTHTACTLSSLCVHVQNTVMVLTCHDLILCVWRCVMSSWLYTNTHKSLNFSFRPSSLYLSIVKTAVMPCFWPVCACLRALVLVRVKFSQMLIWVKPEHYNLCGCCNLCHLLMKVNLIHNITTPLCVSLCRRYTIDPILCLGLASLYLSHGCFQSADPRACWKAIWLSYTNSFIHLLMLYDLRSCGFLAVLTLSILKT